MAMRLGRPDLADGRPSVGVELDAASLPADQGPRVLALGDRRATDAAVAGAKAANLALARAAGLPVLGGFVLTTTAAGRGQASWEAELCRWWGELSDGGRRPLVVRSSSTVEDAGQSSMAGRFTTVLDVFGWPAFLDAVGTVLASAAGPAADGARPAPMAVLVQRHLRAAMGGVLFGVDPVTGSTRHLVAESVTGGPDALVDGRVEATHHRLTSQGRLVEANGPGPVLDRARRRALAALARAAADAFGAAQDVEWAIDGDDRLWLLQSRPVTAAGPPAARGPLMGPGPVAETLPDALTTLEAELWAEPLRRGIAEALRLSGTVGRRRLARSPVVVMVEGRAAADLDLLGASGRRRSGLARLDPRPPARRLMAAWDVGRLRAALPALVDDLLARVDDEVAAVPLLDQVGDVELSGLFRRGQQMLVALHGHEVLAGMLMPESGGGSAAAVALAAVSAGRAEGLSDDQITSRSPEALALVPPRIGKPAPLPSVAPSAGPGGSWSPLSRREALRLRARYVQEITARAAAELADRLVRTGRLARPEQVRHLGLDELEGLVAGAPAPADLDQRVLDGSPPLPARFRLSADGRVISERDRSSRGRRGRRGGRPPAAGRGAGGGRGNGPVHLVGDGRPPRAGEVLVVRTLDPGLAASLPGLAGLVAETGSVLSHLAILARELGVPTVVAVTDALDRFAPGATVLVDGTTGEVQLSDEHGQVGVPADTVSSA